MAKQKQEKKNVFDIILDVFAWISFVIAVIVCLTVILSTFSSAENGKPIFGHKLLIVGSDSMKLTEQSDPDEPIYFEVGDLLIIKEVSDYSEIKVGDVITFVSYNPESKGKTVSHKVRDILTTKNGDLLGFETYGVSTGVSDLAIVEPDTIIGKYVSKVSSIGYLFNFFKTPAGYFTSILIPCILLIIFFSIKVGKLIARRQLAERYDNELALLQDRLNLLENKDGTDMNTNAQELALTADGATEQAEQENKVEQTEQKPLEQEKQVFSQGVQPQVFVGAQNYSQQNGFAPQFVQPPVGIYPSMQNLNTLELTVNALNRTIDSLTRTIENLSNAVGKPVDTLAHTVEVLATATTKPTVIEKVVEVPTPVTAVPQQAPACAPVEPVAPVVAPVEPVVQQAQASIMEEAVVESQNEEVEVEEENIETVVFSEPIQDGKPSIFKDFKSHEKIPFNKKLLSLGSEVKEYFSDVHNELISYKKVHHRISSKGISYRLGRKTLAKMTVRGKTLKLFLALNVNDFSRSVYFQEDSSHIKMYEEVPFTVKIKSHRARNNAIKLVSSVAEQNNLTKNDKFEKENIVENLNINK